MRRGFFVVVAAVLLYPCGLLAQGTLRTIQETGPQDKRINIVIFAEGYLATDEAEFVADATAKYSYLLGIAPWNAYASYMNGYAIFVASAQSGSDDPSAGVFVNTYFSSTFDSYGIARLLTISPNDFDPVYANGEGRVYALLATHLPAYDVVLVLANDPQYGGSGGSISVSSMHGSAPEIVVHELGHSYAGLADEYDYGGAASHSHTTVPEQSHDKSLSSLAHSGDESATPFAEFFAGGAANVTTATEFESIEWNVWILPSTPIPTPETGGYSSVVGLFEGANYQSTGWYRPKLDCKMKTLGPPFCEVCKEAHVLSNYDLVSPIDSSVPGTAMVAMELDEAETLRVVIKSPTTPMRILWYDDGVELNITATPQAIIQGSDLGVGSHDIKCVVEDTTPLVRNDPAESLKDSAAWMVEVTGVSCDCDCHADPACDGVATIVDVVKTIDVAFRGVSPTTSGICPFEDTDTDCTGVTNVLDVVRTTNVAFRNADPATEFCTACP